MRKVAKVIVFIGMLPVILGAVGFFGLIVASIIQCNSSFCKEDLMYLPWFILYGLFYTLPAAAVIAFLYELVLARLEKRRGTGQLEVQKNEGSVTAKAKEYVGALDGFYRSAGSIMLVLFAAVALYFVVALIIDAKNNRASRLQRVQDERCAEYIQKNDKSGSCTEEIYLQKTNPKCSKVVTAREGKINERRTFYLDKEIFRRCATGKIPKGQ